MDEEKEQLRKRIERVKKRVWTILLKNNRFPRIMFQVPSKISHLHFYACIKYHTVNSTYVIYVLEAKCSNNIMLVVM